MHHPASLGCEVIVAGKLKGKRARKVKYRMGKLDYAGSPTLIGILDVDIRYVSLAAGSLGIKVKIMKH